MRARFAPSPTGDLHLGGAYIAIAAHSRAKSADAAGRFIVRVEDLDPPRVIRGAEGRILDDLNWLGLRADEGVREGGAFGPYRQSERAAVYDAAIAALTSLGVVYPCTCTRAEIARAASAPHEGEEGPRYPGTCRDPANRRPGRPAALRVRIPEDERARVSFVDLFAGAQIQNVAEIVGDFVLRRAGGICSYQLAVVVDDRAMAIDEVLRGEDLLASTPRQILLGELLRAAGQHVDRGSPRYGHLPLVRGPDRERLAKRHQSRWRGSTIAELRADGVAATEIVGEVRSALDGALGEERLDAIPRIPDERRPSARSIVPWSPPSRWLRLRETSDKSVR